MVEDKGGKDPPDKFIRQENLYQYTDSGPFEIYIQCNNKNIGNYRILGIAKTVLDMKLTDVKKINKKGKNRIGVEFKTFQAANELAKNEELKKKGHDVFIPINKVTCKGIVKPLDKEFSDEILKKYSEIKTPINCGVLNVRRFTHFLGTSLPKKIFICGLSYRVIPYISPVVQCYNCLLYGHAKKLCKRGTGRCTICREVKNDKHWVDGKCENKLCMYCGDDSHFSTCKTCPEYIRQKKFKEVMSLDNLTYFEANELLPKLPTVDLGFIPVNQRRAEIINQNRRPFKSIPKNNDKKRKLPHQQNNSMEEHKKLLISPNGQFSRSISPDSIYTINGTPRSSRDEMFTQIGVDLNEVGAKLNATHEEQVLNFITQLITGSINNQNDTGGENSTMESEER
ncbi:hypothetical protein JTB14_026919 [Gonioctena quinquepunctata]|nr:hypothetical protein JTB14_026919 [Gonioctena quinquepunctata]